MVDEYAYQDQYVGEVSLKLRDLEQKQRILKERLLLIGENLVEMRDKMNKENLELKKDIAIINNQLTKMVSFLESASQEMPKFARREDVDILYKQARMFQGLDKQ